MVLLLSPAASNAQTEEASAPAVGTNAPPRPKIGLALSGGGARGAAHVGVLKVLEELRIPIDYIAGTSMGSIIAGLYASGRSAQEIETILQSMDWDDAFNDKPPRADLSFRRKRDDDFNFIGIKPGLRGGEIRAPSALILGQKFDLILNRLTNHVAEVRDFDKLSIPYRAIATDIVNGEAVVIKSGSLAHAMRASMSVPGAFAAAEIDGRLLIDGGVANNIPIDVVREMGADIVISVDISTPLMDRKALSSAFSIVGQLTGLLTRRNVEERIASLRDDDLLLIPDLHDITSADFDKYADAIGRGIAVTKEHQARLAQLSLSETAFQQHLAQRPAIPSIRPNVDFIRIDNTSPLSDAFIRSRISVPLGKPLDVAQLEEDISRFYGLDLFESVRYEQVRENGRSGVVIHVREKSWGPNYLQFGFAAEGNLEGSNSFNFDIAYTKTMLNALNGEWRTVATIGEDAKLLTELYQPVDMDSRYYVRPSVTLIDKSNLNVYEGENLAATYRVTRHALSIALGRELGQWGAAELGVKRSTGKADLLVGTPNVPLKEFDGGEFFASFAADKMDNLYFPKDGYMGALRWHSSREGLGADAKYDQYQADVVAAKTWRRQTVMLGARYLGTVDDNAPAENLYRAGGLFNLSGYETGELSGQHVGLLRALTMRRVNDFKLAPTYVGLSVEYGDVSQTSAELFDSAITAGSLFLGIDTPIGALYLGAGKAEGGHHAYYAYLGRSFAARMIRE